MPGCENGCLWENDDGRGSDVFSENRGGRGNDLYSENRVGVDLVRSSGRA